MTECRVGATPRFEGERTVNHYDAFANTPVVEQLPRGFGHPAQKPVALCEWFVRTYTERNEVVLDNVCGSGTTLVAARNAGRRAVGIEVREDYIEMAIARLASGSTGDRW